MSITYFDWLPSIRKAFVIPNKIHRTNLLASTYTLVQGISRWSARIEIKGLCLSLWEFWIMEPCSHIQKYAAEWYLNRCYILPKCVLLKMYLQSSFIVSVDVWYLCQEVQMEKRLRWFLNSLQQRILWS